MASKLPKLARLSNMRTPSWKTLSNNAFRRNPVKCSDRFHTLVLPVALMVNRQDTNPQPVPDQPTTLPVGLGVAGPEKPYTTINIHHHPSTIYKGGINPSTIAFWDELRRALVDLPWSAIIPSLCWVRIWRCSSACTASLCIFIIFLGKWLFRRITDMRLICRVNVQTDLYEEFAGHSLVHRMLMLMMRRFEAEYPIIGFPWFPHVTSQAFWSPASRSSGSTLDNSWPN